KESYPEESRKPFVRKATIIEDCSRRDFTINAVVENLVTGEIFDFFSGREDMKKRILRTPVDPSKTFYDDALRILRGIRFAAKLQFEIDEETLEGMKKNVFRLKIISQERITDELFKILELHIPSRGLYLMDRTGVLDVILPEVSELKNQSADNCKELFPHTLKVLDNVSRHTKNTNLKMAALLHDIGKPKTFREEKGKVSFHRHEFVGERMAYNICRRLRVSEENTRFIGFLIRYHLRPHLLAKENPTDSALRRFIKETGKNMKPLFTLAKADITSNNMTKIASGVKQLEILQKRTEELNRKDRLTSFRLAVDGYRIMDILELPTGRKVGFVKDYLEDMVMDGFIENKKRILTKFLKESKSDILKHVLKKENE
ncbi:MAG TPA: HD domain-containing protein, partial [bacterium]|nr:HD domain-containing protein [bacterium]